MKLQKRDCPLEIELVPSGAGLTYVYLATGKEKLSFIISDVLGAQFSELVQALYFFSPYQNDSAKFKRNVEFVNADIALDDLKPELAAEIRSGCKEPMTTVEFIDIPYRAEFTWDEEPGYSHWVLERTPNMDSDFFVKLYIELAHCEKIGVVYQDAIKKEFDFNFRYKDLCYAVAKAHTKSLKEFGFWGFHVSANHDSICVHELLFLKAVALDCLEIRNTTPRHSGRYTRITKIEDELELLLFDM